MDFGEWAASQPAAHVIIIGGNHDCPLERYTSADIADIFPQPNVHYLNNSHVEVLGYKLVGVPLSVGKSRNNAFQSDRCVGMTRDYVDSLLQSQSSSSSSLSSLSSPPTPPPPPSNVILLTHGSNENIVKLLKPRYHFYGHYHSSYGAKFICVNGGGKGDGKDGGKDDDDANDETVLSVCSSIMDHSYIPRNLPVVVDIVKR
jgi:hypothetical protein